MTNPSIPLDEYAQRRNKLLRSLKGAVGLVFAGEQTSHLADSWRPHAHFLYLTGIEGESGAAIMLDPTHPVEKRRVMLFLRPLNPEVEKWDGLRAEVGAALRRETGVETIFRTNMLPRFLRDAARRSKRLACLHPLASHVRPVSPDLDVFRKVAERIPGVTIEDQSELIPQMRSSKSRAEIAMIQHAVDITATGYQAVLERLKPGMSEFEVQEMLEHAYKVGGSRGTLYRTIVGGGVNATVLHYRANDQTLEDGDLVCIDSAAEYGGYSADVTRTFPINGTFTDRQREIYNLVLKAQQAAIRAVKPGVRIADVDKAARDVIEKAGYGDHFFHGIGHHLGLETHDASPDEPVRQGAVLTIEPGVYLPDERIGVRIEDDVVVTKTGSRNLSTKIPKKADEIEKIMADARKS